MLELISLVDAAALLQPFIGDINALNLLSDWRRNRPRYRKRLINPPPPSVKHDGVVKYPPSEIERGIRDLITFRLFTSFSRSPIHPPRAHDVP